MANSSTDWSKIVIFTVIALAIGAGIYFLYTGGADFFETLKRIASVFTFNIIRNAVVLFLALVIGILVYEKTKDKEKKHGPFFYIILFLICFVASSLGGDDLNQTLFGGNDGTYVKDGDTMYGILLPSVTVAGGQTVYPIAALLLTAFLTWATISALEYMGKQQTGRDPKGPDEKGFIWIKGFVTFFIAIGAARRGVMLATLGTWGYFLGFFFVYRFTLAGFPKEGAEHTSKAKSIALGVAIILTEYIAEMVVGSKSTPPFLPPDPTIKIVLAIGIVVLIRALGWGVPILAKKGTKLAKEKFQSWFGSVDDLEEARRLAGQQAGAAGASAQGGASE